MNDIHRLEKRVTTFFPKVEFGSPGSGFPNWPRHINSLDGIRGTINTSHRQSLDYSCILLNKIWSISKSISQQREAPFISDRCLSIVYFVGHMEKKSKLWIRSVYYYLKRCVKARFSKITTSGRNLNETSSVFNPVILKSFINSLNVPLP